MEYPIEVEYPIELLNPKTVQDLAIEPELQFVMDLQIAGECKIDLEFLLDHWVGQTVLIIDQEFRLA